LAFGFFVRVVVPPAIRAISRRKFSAEEWLGPEILSVVDRIVPSSSTSIVNSSAMLVSFLDDKLPRRLFFQLPTVPLGNMLHNFVAVGTLDAVDVCLLVGPTFREDASEFSIFQSNSFATSVPGNNSSRTYNWRRIPEVLHRLREEVDVGVLEAERDLT